MAWLKYRHNEAAGRGEWEWRDIGNAFWDPVTRRIDSEIIHELESSHSWHEQYRGVEVGDVVELPPTWVIESELASLTEQFRAAENRIRQLDEILGKTQPCPLCHNFGQTHGPGRRPCTQCGREGMLAAEVYRRIKEIEHVTDLERRK